MSKINLDNYVPVNERLMRFWAKYPDGAIKTELLYADEKYVRVYAAAFSEKDAVKLLATGLAEEVRGVGMTTTVSAIETCETSAIGRALANAGFEVQRGIASREEMEKVVRHESAPKKPEKDIPMEPASDEYKQALDVITDSEAESLAEIAKEWIGGDPDRKSKLKLKLVALGAGDVDGRKKLASVMGQLDSKAATGLMEWLKDA